MFTNLEIMTVKRIAFVIIFLSIILLVRNIFELNFNDLKGNEYSGIASNILVILGMIFTIFGLRKTKSYLIGSQ